MKVASTVVEATPGRGVSASPASGPVAAAAAERAGIIKNQRCFTTLAERITERRIREQRETFEGVQRRIHAKEV
jgi:hypothetical protein